MKLTITAKIGNKKIIKTTSKVVPEPATEFESGIELEFNIAAELEFNMSVELFSMDVAFKSNAIL
jgi:hypothetical protein